MHHGTLEDVAGASATIVSADLARVGDELRVELSDERGALFAIGLARVRAVDAVIGVTVDFLALGTDARVLAALGGAPAASPPALPGVVGGPPPLRLDRAPQPVTAAPHEDDDDVAPVVEPLAVKKRGIVIGIDLGTTNTCASYVVDGRAVVIPGRTGTSTIPSMITFDPDGTFHIGQRAADRQVLHPTRTVYGSKRLLGRTYRSELAAQLQAHFAYPLAEAEGQRFGVRVDDRVISMDTIAARVLDEVRGSAEAYLKQPIEAAIITVPAYFSEVQREAVRRAAAQAKLTVYRIVNEPTAAAVAYGHKQEKEARIAVWDFGGGTFDFSVVEVSEGQLEVIATGGDNFVGGSDIDDLIASHLLTEFQRIEGLALEPDPQQIARLRDAADVAKRALSVETETMVEVRELTREPKRDLRVQLTRERFDALIAPLVERTVAIATEVMAASGIEPSSIDDVLLVGGTTRVPAVQQAVAALFGRRPSKRINPDEAVALGAALLADEIGAGGAPTLLDILPMTIGRGMPNRRFEAIVPRYARVPAHHELTVEADILGSVYVPLFQGESSDVAGNEYLCSVLVEDRVLWDGGRVTLRLSFDEHCVMTIEASDARTGKALVAQLDRSRPVEAVLRDLGVFEGPTREVWRLPETPLGKVLGKLFK
ncbi:MAG: Hsp70 family protein, partial [Myxococcota bacterium]|nr:Hsp70 family protein [Myxococcota bacterium]